MRNIVERLGMMGSRSAPIGFFQRGLSDSTRYIRVIGREIGSRVGKLAKSCSRDSVERYGVDEAFRHTSRLM